eukprot:comp12062_c0_seq1/m.6774 comp12062_c0_seq1/g.6774  ORF comp12062_c0_seq1/g.6774 comp12062_c0_seq1/m.6774 type:complete len:456 (-) comp12062_c0_seq1:579-1946(-)
MLIRSFLLALLCHMAKLSSAHPATHRTLIRYVRQAEAAVTEQKPVTPSPATDCGISVGTDCFSSLIAAIESVAPGGTVTVNGNVTVTSEIPVTKTLSVVGAGGDAAITANLGSKKGVTIFRGNTANITLSLADIFFLNIGEIGSVFRTTDLGTGEFIGEGDPGPVSLVVRNCKFEKFFTDMRGGSVFSMGTSRKIDIQHSTFNNNTVFFEEDMYEGGGAIWAYTAVGDFTFSGNSFYGNKNLFGHGLGGAICLNNLTGMVEITGNDFIENVANGGGAIYIGNMSSSDSQVTIDSKFIRNRAQDNGWHSGARGGAVWLAQIRGTVDIDGTYDGNECREDRGGVFANNRNWGTVNLKGTYDNNVANTTRGGSIWDTHYENSGKFNNDAKIGFGNSVPAIKLEKGKDYVSDEEKVSGSVGAAGAKATPTSAAAEPTAKPTKTKKATTTSKAKKTDSAA